MNSSEITDLDSGIQTKSKYRGNVQAIPFTLVITGAVNTSHVISKVLPQEARVISSTVAYPDLGTGATVDLGYADDADGTVNTNRIIDGASDNDSGLLTFPSDGTASAISTLGSIDVGNKQLLLTIAGADAATGGSGNEGTIDVTIVGHVLIATNE
jgi:hypothetical protein|tara:strand:+ start:957 stop:1424 length:468 start_codon:yes stop_codon:yes gene_type:complete